MNHNHHTHKNHKEHENHDKHAGHSLEMFIRKFWISLGLTLVIILYSPLTEKFLSWQAPVFNGSSYLTVILASIVFFYGGWVFLTSAWQEIKAKLPGMMTLIALATGVAYVFSLWAEFSKTGETLFWELATLITIMLLGHWLEMKAVRSASGALKELSKLLPDEAELINGEIIQRVKLSELKPNDIVLIRPGGKVPADAVVIDGRSHLNEAMITGESRPVEKTVGSELIAGTVNSDGILKAKITKVGEHTFLAGVMRLVKEAQSSKSRLQILSDRAAFYLTILALSVGSITIIAWLVAGAKPAFAIERLVAVLVIACPHALGLAIPLVASISTTLAARNGFLVKQRLALEQARKINIVLFDKTGTLTKGEYGVQEIWPAELESEEEILKLAASLDVFSEHFISKAIVEKARAKNLKLFEVKNFTRLAGRGITGQINETEVMVGGQAILEIANLKIPELISQKIKSAGEEGKTIIYVVQNKKVAGALALSDLIREESREAIEVLGSMNVEIALVTGDSNETAAWAARELGIKRFFGRVLPDEKAEKVRSLQAQGLKVAMVGDGINDAPALAQADLGVAIGAGTNVAIESAGIILVKNDPRDIAKIIKLSRATYSKMIQNLFWATAYNLVAMPLAAGILYSKGIMLEPAVAAVFMSLSTIVVAFNAILLKGLKLTAVGRSAG